MKYLMIILTLTSLSIFAADKPKESEVAIEATAEEEAQAKQMLKTLEKGKKHQEDQKKALDELDQEQ